MLVLPVRDARHKAVNLNYREPKLMIPILDYEAKVTTYSDYTYALDYTTSVDFGATYTRVVPVKPTNTAVAPLSIDTTTDKYYDGVTIVNVLLPTGAGEAITADYSTTTTSYRYYVKLSYTAPTACATQWVYTTSASAYLPPMITPTPTSVSTSVSQYEAFGEKSTYYYAFIDPAILPTSSLESIKSNYGPYFTSSCTVPYSYQTGLVTSGTGGSSNSGSSDSSSSSSGSGSSSADECYEDFSGYYNQFLHTYKCPDGRTYTTGLADLSIALIIIFGWLGLFLIIGLLESYIAFSRLCRGRHARRGLPISFAFLFPFLSCFFLCCHQRGFQGKSAEEQETLTAAWKEMGFFTKLGKWLKWGFRYKYPDFLGAAPSRRQKWQDKDTPVPVGANAMPPMTGPMGPMPPPGSMYVVANPADGAQRGGAPGAGWYAPQPVDANGNPVPMQYQYVYPPQGYVPQQGQGAPEVVPGSVPGAVVGPQSGAPSGPPPGIPRSLQPGQGSPPLPTRPAPAHISAEEQTRSLPTDSPVSPASALAGGSPVVAGAVPVVTGGEVVGRSEVVHEADSGEVGGGKGKGPALP
ncbi:hypothetical protein VE02_09121 [Pseudogymnoascus sp. 03VT05]|nr:hypothetical protein VE02_09121 [Pseudogymnoascus sp. 03VT05]